MMENFALNAADQLRTYDAYVNDDRGVVPTGFDELDAKLRRGGLARGELVLLGGRTGTRKTTTSANMIANMLSDGRAVGLVGLDGSVSNNYLGRLFSAWSGLTMEEIEHTWNKPEREEQKHEYEQWAERLSVYNGPLRPAPADLTQWLLESENPKSGTHRPEVVFIDYVSLLFRDRFAGAENQRVPRLIEELQVWARQHEVITIALHQVGRLDEGVSVRYHGHTPMSLEGLKYGGEEIADVVLACYRPSNDPVGKWTFDMARQSKGDKFTYEDYEAAVNLVKKYEPYTFLQLLKNRPAVETYEQGWPLRSEGRSQKMIMQSSVETPVLADIDPGDMMKAYGEESKAVSAG